MTTRDEARAACVAAWGEPTDEYAMMGLVFAVWGDPNGPSVALTWDGEPMLLASLSECEWRPAGGELGAPRGTLAEEIAAADAWLRARGVVLTAGEGSDGR